MHAEHLQAGVCVYSLPQFDGAVPGSGEQVTGGGEV